MSSASESPSTDVPMTDFTRYSVYGVTAMSLYAPCAIAAYNYLRTAPAIRYRNPVEITVTSSFAFLYGLARCLVTLFKDKINCTTRILLPGLPMQIAFLSYVLATLRVVLTFKVTELMVARSSPAHERLLARLHLLLRRRALSLPWFGLQLAWNLPLVVFLLATDYDDTIGEPCSTQMYHSYQGLYAIEVCLVVVATSVLTYFISHVVDNFGLRRAYLGSAYGLFALFAIDFPVTVIFNGPIVSKYALDLFIDLFSAHVMIWIHVVLPLLHALTSNASNEARAFKGTSSILEAYLQTKDGYRVFVEFAKLEFVYEAVAAWKDIFEFKTNAPDHYTADAIFDQYLGDAAPLPLQNFVPAHVWKRYQVAFGATKRYSIHPGIDDNDADNASVVVRSNSFFDVVYEALMQLFLTETLPHFQDHPLGDQWLIFVAQFHATRQLDRVLLATVLPHGDDLSTIRHKSYDNGHLIRIESGVESSRLRSSLGLTVHPESDEPLSPSETPTTTSKVDAVGSATTQDRGLDDLPGTH
ncbi:Aste57867_23547 [Aphanomyces stellatus]|uniref:Aste57867_23547 protein n=1 Tax=Aphanomyces stellatus TaxID=120398 RepID=A0A485LSI4_9STRA|nr:hypothetical protein As57867_023476 [Aphanomyces stellatus]VFU00192.1 Aste57867_23547 [Aphanomyces stellatus]